MMIIVRLMPFFGPKYFAEFDWHALWNCVYKISPSHNSYNCQGENEHKKCLHSRDIEKVVGGRQRVQLAKYTAAKSKANTPCLASVLVTQYSPVLSSFLSVSNSLSFVERYI